MTGGLIASISNSLATTSHALNQLLQANALQRIAAMAESMVEVIKSGNKLLVCGNGGSAAQAMHFAEELTGRYRKDRKALPALSLTDPTHLTCVGNDYGFEQVFSRAIEAYAKPGDGVLLLSTSGNSANLIQVLPFAKEEKLTTYALLGKGGGKLHKACDHEIVVPGETSDCVQNLHMMIIHCLIESIERMLFPENYPLTCDQAKTEGLNGVL